MKLFYRLGMLWIVFFLAGCQMGEKDAMMFRQAESCVTIPPDSALYLGIIFILGSLFAFMCYHYRHEKRKRREASISFAEQIQENEICIKHLRSEQEISIQSTATLKKAASMSESSLQKEKEKVCDLEEQVERLKLKQQIQIEQNKNLSQINKELTHALSLMKTFKHEEYLKYHSALCILIQVFTTPHFGACGYLNSEDWNQLFDFVDLVRDDSLRKRLPSCEVLSELDQAVCYFTYLGVKHCNQADFFGITSESLIKKKQRLKKKMGFKSSSSLDKVLNLLCNN